MKIGIDIQALQTEGSKNRGIGRYSKDLFSNILKINQKDEFTFFVNNYYSSKVELPKNHNTTFQKIKFVNEKSNGFNIPILNELAQFFQFYISNQDIIHISSPFEGWNDKFPVISRYASRLNGAIVTTLYDLIPLVFSKEYLVHENVKKYYYQRLNLLKQYDLIFSISEATRQDAINFLNIEPSKIVNIGSAAGDSFQKINVSVIERNKIRKKFSITEHFVLYTGGIDIRKNVERTIEAFSKLDKSLINKYSFVIVCKITQSEKEALLNLADNFGIKNKIVFTGFIPDSDLNVLYNTCDLFIFPSLYEGSGLPVLEAMKCGAPVICSNTSSMVELMQKNEYMFNPYDVDEISMKLEQVLKDEQFKNNLKQHCANQGKQFSWEKSAKIVLDEYNKLNDKIKEKKQVNRNLGLKPTLAYFSPLPPLKSGIAEYSKRLLPSLAKYYDIDVFIDNYSPSKELMSINCVPIDKFEKFNSIEKYDHILYHMGNSDHHFFMLDTMKKNKGVIVLHDLFLGPMQYKFLQQKDIRENINSNKDTFFNDLIYSHGKIGEKYTSQFKKGLISIDKIFDELPVIKKFLCNSSGIIVHSNWSKNKIKNLYPNFENIKTVNFNSPQLITHDKNKTKLELGFSKNEFIIGSFGIVGFPKRLDKVLKNLKNFLLNHKNSRYIIVGYIDDNWKPKISKIINELKLEEKVVMVGFVDFELYKKYLSITDICINLRYPTRGETSSTMFDLLRAGIPTIVSNEGPLGELPDDCVMKVKINEEQRLEEIVRELESNPGLREKISNNSRSYASKEGNLDTCTLQYDQAIKFFENERENEIKNELEDRLVKFVSKELFLSGASELDEDSLNFISGLMCEAINAEQN